MRMSKKTAATSAVLTTMTFMGAGLAQAASHSINVSGDGAYTTNATYNLLAQKTNVGYKTSLNGQYHVTAPSDHLNAKVSGMGYTQLVRRTSADTVPYAWLISPAPGDEYAPNVTLQTCREHWYGDDCNSSTGSTK